MIETIPKRWICPACGSETVRMCLECNGDGSAGPILDDPTDTNPPLGYTAVSSNGLIIDTDSTSAALFGTKRIALIGKPFTIFVHDEDLVDFFIHRNAFFTTHKEQNFEIRLRKKDRSFFSAKLECTFIRDLEKNMDCMQIAIQDYTMRRRALNQLGHQLDLENIIRSITANMIRCPTREVDASLTRELKTLAMFTEVERTYLGIIDEKKTNLSLTHEWCASKIVPIQETMNSIMLNQLPGLKKSISSGKLLLVSEVDVKSGLWASELNRIHIAGTKSFAYFPLQANRSNRGIIGYDALSEKSDWDQGFSYLFQFVGHAFMHAILRKQNETAWLNRHKQALCKTISPSDQSADRVALQPGETALASWNVPLKLEDTAGDIHEIFEISGNPLKRNKEPKWQYQEISGDHSAFETLKVRIIDEKMLITCPRCMRQDQIRPEHFNVIGKTVMATCPCLFQFELKSEMRSYYRKEVDLEGVFLRTKSENFLSDSIDYSGKVGITNISKKGLGFVTEGPSDLRVGDQIRIKFTLDNQARSAITKQVLIKGVKDHYAGGQFVGPDKNDITLGFYLM